jgi:hypothetical protein
MYHVYKKGYDTLPNLKKFQKKMYLKKTDLNQI